MAGRQLNLARTRQLIAVLEGAKFDAFVVADHLAFLNMLEEALKRSQTVSSFEQFSVCPHSPCDRADRPDRHRIDHLRGAFHVARRFASLDHISGGRAGRNFVTTGNPETSFNIGRDERMEHGDSYARAREYRDVVTRLWDSWADDAFVRDVESGIFFDPRPW
jgi:alkanesulfonate monooxygenase SsuD/methylene tetrahydromethanopterin reductase-like flavin-dependent oxidoreductase (luciferase family)